MPVTGTNSENQDMRMLVKELVIDGDPYEPPEPLPDPGAAISDITLTGTYDGDDATIAGAINDILAALRAYGVIAEA